MKLRFQNKNETKDFGIPNLKPSWSPYNKRSQTTKRFGGDGEQEVGDQLVDGRSFNLDFEFTPSTPFATRAAQDLEYSDLLNDIAGFFLKINAPFHLIDLDISRRARIILQSLNDSIRPGLEKRISFIKMKAKFPDAYWEDSAQNSQADAVVSGGTFEIDNDSFIDAFPILEIVPLATNSDFLIQNQTTGDAFVLGSANFGVGTTFIVNSQDGTIILDNGISQVENSVSLADGSGFIKLAPGVNTLLYESAFGGVTVTTKWRRRYAF